jgi:hypothetical protein
MPGQGKEKKKKKKKKKKGATKVTAGGAQRYLAAGKKAFAITTST